MKRCKIHGTYDGRKYRCPKCPRYHIPINQRRRLSICPHCKRRFYYWQKASEHAKEFKHYGSYNYEKKEAEK